MKANRASLGVITVFASAVMACAGPTGSGPGGGQGGDWIDTGPLVTGGSDVGGGGMGGAGGFEDVGGGGAGGTQTSSSSDPDLTELCTDTGGTPGQKQCCAIHGQWPDTCVEQPNCGGVITCSGGIDPDLWLCACPEGTCFDQELGCTDSI